MTSAESQKRNSRRHLVANKEKKTHFQITLVVNSTQKLVCAFIKLAPDNKFTRFFRFPFCFGRNLLLKFNPLGSISIFLNVGLT